MLGRTSWFCWGRERAYDQSREGLENGSVWGDWGGVRGGRRGMCGFTLTGGLRCSRVCVCACACACVCV